MPYKSEKTEIPDLIILEPTVHTDDRGCFFESYNHRDFHKIVGLGCDFVQDNHSKSKRGVLRGLHYQIQHPQGKLVRVIQGAVFDVAVDLRRSSMHFGRWFGIELSAENKRQFWIPPGFAHGFIVTTETAEFLYKTTDYWFPEHERTLLWNDGDLGIRWPDGYNPNLSDKDLRGKSLKLAEVFD